GQGARLFRAAVLGPSVPDMDPVVKSFALSLACGVLFDGLVVGMTLVPAVMAMLGDKAWWLPRRVDRRLPDIDIEGARLLAGLREPGTAVTSDRIRQPIPAR